MTITKEEALKYHSEGIPGKLATLVTKRMDSRRDLSLAYSPGVAEPCLEIHRNIDLAYEFTSKSSTVAFISNGTAVLGLGDIGALASKPVMEGKAALLHKFAHLNGVDIEIESRDKDEVVNVIKNIGRTWGAINLEDIKAPECFYIEEKLQQLLDIPVFHDDQHGTAIVCLAATINALKITERKKEDVKIVINGAGAAAVATGKLLKHYGFKNITMCDTKGVIYKGRTEGMNKYKDIFAIETDKRTLKDAVKNADIFIGLSVKGALSEEMLKSMNKDPIVFAMANPDPEISPDVAKKTREDVIIATGRSDFPNQVNNVLCFPYLFMAALEVQARGICDNIKITIAEILAKIATLEVPQYVKDIYKGEDLSFGRNYLIPKIFDRRIPSLICPEVAKVLIKEGLARREIDIDNYRIELEKEFA